MWHSGSDTQISRKIEVQGGTGLDALETALVWKVYNSESTKMDSAILDASHRSIDVLLMFTGLFSTVLTTFIVQAYQFLVQGPSCNMATLPPAKPPSTLIRTVVAVNTPPQPAIPILPSSAALSLEQLQWINALWFASLAFSLCNAAVCMLGKQWLQPGRDTCGSSPRFKARQRQRRYMQIKAWRILAVIDSLPLFLHVGLILFFAGLVILVWAANHAIAVITCIALMVVYGCYFGSMWLSLVHSDIPYQHPLYEKLRHWKTWLYHSFPCIFSAESHVFRDMEKGVHKLAKEDKNASIHIATPEDDVDAYAFIWLFKNCPNDATSSIALQAIGDLPRNFTAFHILRQAGAIPLILRGFSACFYRDRTLSPTWLVQRPQDAGKYCRAWMRLTNGTSITWPRELIGLLETLRKEDIEDISTIATCTRAVAFVDIRDDRSMIIACLARYMNHRIHFSQEIQCWLLETFLQCSLMLQEQFRPPNPIVKTMVPILLRLLHYHISKDATASNVRSAIALCLSYTIGGTYNPIFLNDEFRRQEEFYNHLIPSLVAIVESPEIFGVDEELLNQMANDFVHVIVQTSKGDFKDWKRFRSIAQLGLSKLYFQGRINISTTSDEDLSDVLQIMFPPDLIISEDRPLFVKSLIQTLSGPAQSPVLLCSALRLLEPLLSYAEPAILDAFIESDGCTVLLGAADVGEMGSRNLQLSCIRNICLFVQSAADNMCIVATPTTAFPSIHPSAMITARLDHIFHSQFLRSITDILASHSFWSLDIPAIWMPTLLMLCQVHPHDPAWKGIEAALSKYAQYHDEKGGYDDLKKGLHGIKALIHTN